MKLTARRLCLIGFLGLAVLVFESCVTAAAAGESPAAPAVRGAPGGVGGVSALRLAHLARGINLGSLFAAGANPLRYESGFSEADLVLLAKEGFTFCRLPIDPSLLFDPQNPSHLRPAIHYVDRVVQLVLAAGLSIVIDPIHTASSEHSFEGALATDGAFAAKVGEYWTAVASRYASRNPNRVFFEIMNEPHASVFAGVKPAWWPPVEKRLARAIRAAAPANTIIATGEEWGSINGLLATRPLPISNVVYSFHFYEPFPFTHQGATWTAPVQRALRDLPYPSSPAAVARVLPGIHGAAARRVALRYGRQRWNIDSIRGEISKAVRWARRYQVPLIDGEFGVFKPFAPPADRYRWLHDVRTVLEGYHIGWAMWQYDSSFGLVSYEYPGIASGTEVDERCLAALGLKVARPDRFASPIDFFERGSHAALTMPVTWLGRLWTRVAHAGTDALAPLGTASERGSAEAARLVINGNTAWVIRPNLTLAVAAGQSYRLTAKALVRGRGSCELSVVGYYADGSAMRSPEVIIRVRDTGKWEGFSAQLFPPPGGTRIGFRWFGKGPGIIELRAIRLAKIS